MRNALIAGLITGMAFTLSHLEFISSFAEFFIYIIAILLGGYHWGRKNWCFDQSGCPPRKFGKNQGYRL
ncbi:MAG: hypothetical protein ACE5D2_05350 [Fidelibacterota bacterium]